MYIHIENIWTYTTNDNKNTIRPLVPILWYPPILT